jgi:hypothetical protein
VKTREKLGKTSFLHYGFNVRKVLKWQPKKINYNNTEKHRKSKEK